MESVQRSVCDTCPSAANCDARGFQPVAAAFRQIRDYIRAVGPAAGANCLAEDTLSEIALRDVAGKLAAARKNRQRSLSQDLLGEPAWDILLELFTQRHPQSMKSIGIGAGVPLTTTLRWIGLLEQQGLLTQQADPHDARRTLVSLTDKGRANVADAVNGIHAAIVGASVEV